MWFKLSQFRVALEVNEQELAEVIAKHLQLSKGRVQRVRILRQSLDARHKALAYIYTVSFEITIDLPEAEVLLAKESNLMIYQPPAPLVIRRITKVSKERPVIIGSGPAGLFAALYLAKAGLRPIIIERGAGLVGRITDVERFWQSGELDPESNIQYGMGGAGTFSDGKLTTRIKDARVAEILEQMIKAGAPAEIRYCQYPHVGTDLLRQVLTNMETEIIEDGGEFWYRQALVALQTSSEGRTRIKLASGEELETELLLLATGNSARDVYRLLAQTGFQLEAKPFAVGLRIEHPQDLIDRAQYGRWVGHPRLGAAEYHLTYQHQATGRGVYSFCMCPGGTVVGATSTVNAVVTNGMSYHARNSGIANAAILVTVGQNDFGTNSVLAGINFQEKLEQKAYTLGGGDYYAPAQRVADFLKQQPSSNFSKLPPSYSPGITPANLWELLPRELSQAISDALGYFNQKLQGFTYEDAVLTGVETRTSAPIRILRDEKRVALGKPGIYPIGEGAGYAGGIISSALDGWRTAEMIVAEYQ